MILNRLVSIILDTMMVTGLVALYWIVCLISVAIWLALRIERLTNGIWLLANWIAYLNQRENSSTDLKNEESTTDD